MRLITHYDEAAPRKERYRVLRAQDETAGNARILRHLPGRWETRASFPTEREANAYAQGFWQGHLSAGGALI